MDSRGARKAGGREVSDVRVIRVGNAYEPPEARAWRALGGQWQRRPAWLEPVDHFAGVGKMIRRPE